jgi:hypothetical protein
MQKSVVSGWLLLVLAAFGSPSVRAARVEIVLDVSGSMRGAAGGTSKMDAAKQAVRTTAEALDPTSVVALRLYGHRLPSEPKDPSCRDTELVIPFGPLDRGRFVAAVDAAKPLGQTPIAYSLEQSAADFGDLGDEQAAVILVSDGEESCGGDPAAVACAFAQRGIELTIHTVGFDVDAAARAQLQAIAQCTGGQYRDARNAGELADSLRQLTQAGLLVDKQRESSGQEVRGGNGFESAVAIAPGNYRLDHHQRVNEYDYFTIEVTPGHALRVTQVAFEIGVTIDGGTYTENDEPTAGVAVHRPDRERIDEDSVHGAGARALAGVTVAAGEGGRYFVLIGQGTYSMWGIHKDSPFTIELLDLTDVGSGTDAGSVDRDAVEIAPGEHRGWLQSADEWSTDEDVFGFAADSAATYGVRVRPELGTLRLEVSVADEDGVVLASGDSANEGAGVRLENIRPPRNGRVFVTVSGKGPMRDAAAEMGSAASAYSLELTQQGGAAPTSTAADEPSTSTDEEAATAGRSDDAERGSPLSAIPGGLAGCAALLVLGFLVVAGLAVGVFVVLRRRG